MLARIGPTFGLYELVSVCALPMLFRDRNSSMADVTGMYLNDVAARTTGAVYHVGLHEC